MVLSFSFSLEGQSLDVSVDFSLISFNLGNISVGFMEAGVTSSIVAFSTTEGVFTINYSLCSDANFTIAFFFLTVV
jgi:hypothetical protein